MRYTDIDSRIEAVASAQYSAFNRQQAFEAGASERFVQRRLAEKAWIRPVPGVYALARSPGTWLRQCKIAELSVNGSSIVCNAAAAVNDLPDFRQCPIALLIPANASCRHPSVTIHRYAGAAVTDVKGIRVTTIAQTVFDLISGAVSGRKVERAIDDCLLTGRLTLDDLQERSDFYKDSRRPGVAAMNALIAERSSDAWTPPESELEALLYAVLEQLPGSPRIVRQAALPWRSPRPGRVDTLLPDHRLIVEADGRRWHARLADFDRDRWRDNEAVAHGYRVQRFTWVHLNQFRAESLALIEQTLTTLAA